MSDEAVFRLATQFDDARHEIDRLRAVNAKLRRALEEIASGEYLLIRCRTIAAAALKAHVE